VLAADRAFARFCHDGDVDALGRTFDLTAPRLVIVAAHLAGGDHADDLVQTTSRRRAARRSAACRSP
jgi:hypothetical protein